MKLLIENNKGHILIDDITGRIIYIVVDGAIPNKRDFLSIASYQNNPDGTQTATRFVK